MWLWLLGSDFTGIRFRRSLVPSTGFRLLLQSQPSEYIPRLPILGPHSRPHLFPVLPHSSRGSHGRRRRPLAARASPSSPSLPRRCTGYGHAAGRGVRAEHSPGAAWLARAPVWRPPARAARRPPGASRPQVKAASLPCSSSPSHSGAGVNRRSACLSSTFAGVHRGPPWPDPVPPWPGPLVPPQDIWNHMIHWSVGVLGK